jgi:hypothetical protein
MQATTRKNTADAAKLAASGSPRQRATSARLLLLDAGWDEDRISAPVQVGELLVMKVAPADEPRLSVVLGREEAAVQPASLAYSSESELMVHWGAAEISLGQPTHWDLLPGDSPGLTGDAADRWTLEDIFALLAPEKLLGGEAEQVSNVGKAHETLAIGLGNALAILRGDAAEVDLPGVTNLDREVLRLFHQLLFIRVQEDRGEGCGERIATVYEEDDDRLVPSLSTVLEAYRETLNSDLFKPSLLPLEKLGARRLRPLLQSLVLPWQELQLNFSLSRADLAGRLYQQYLKKTPAVEKAGEGRRPRLVPVAVQRDEQEQTAAYYTPMSVASLLAADTLGAWLKDRSPAGPEDVRLIDPACGSGSFLVAGYHLIKAALEGGGRALRPAKREAILRESLFGADIDAKAIEITQLQLLEAAELSRARLPDLDQNLFVGDSLHPPSGGEEAPPEAVPWQLILDRVGGFDAVLMNPPFGAQLRLSGRLEAEQRAALRERFADVADWGSDLAYYFVSLAFALKKEDGCAGMIVPRKLLDGKSAGATRRFLTGVSTPDRIVDFRGLALFPGILPQVALLEFLPGRHQVEALDVSDSTVDSALALNTILERRNGIVRRTRTRRADLGELWTPFALRWRSELRDQLGRECERLGEVGSVSVHQGTQTGAQKAFTIAERSWRLADDGDEVEVDGHCLERRYAPLVAWGPDIAPLIEPRRRERLFFPFEEDKSTSEDPQVQALLAARGGFSGTVQAGAVAALRAPKVILRGFSREPAAFADAVGEWITVKGTKGGLIIVPARPSGNLLDGIAGLLCSSLDPWLLRGFGQPRRDETIEILQGNAEELPWPQLSKEEWAALAKGARATTLAAVEGSGAQATVSYREARARLDALTFDLLEVGDELRETVTRELTRYL